MSEDYGVFLIIGLVVVALLLGTFYLASQDEKRWQKYSSDHHCKAKGTRQGQVTTGVGPSMGKDGGLAVTTSVEPDQTIYVCDNGEMVIR